MPSFDVQASAVLAAPRDLVWSRLVDRDAVSGWLDDVDHLTGSPGRFATQCAAEPCVGPIEGRVLAIERERRLRVVLRAPWRLLREIELDLRLEPAEVGTILSVDATWHLSWLGWLVRPLVRLRADIALRRAARGFRAAVEDEAARRRRRASRAASPDAHLASPSQDALLLRTAS
ncbi:MAG: SRPBCC family protein [Candidatus Binatia bacterium]